MEYVDDIEAGRNPTHRYYLIQFEQWEETQRRPSCRVVENLGEAGGLEAEERRLLKLYDVCQDKYEDDSGNLVGMVGKEMDKYIRDIDSVTNEWKIPESEIKKRLDLRKKRIFSIDPVTAKDLDDALSIEQISDQVFEIGVHIADVSHFV